VEFAREARGRGIRFSRVVSYGNGCDLNESDLLEHAAQDDETEIVAMYLEGPREGRRFVRLVKELAPRKPIIIWKAGLTGAGARAVHSHTASLGGEEEVWRGLFKQTAAIPVRDLEEMADTVLAFLHLPASTGRRVAVVGGGGGISVAAAEACDRVGLEIPPFDDRVQRKLWETLPVAGTSVRNPVDVGVPLVPAPAFERVLDTVASIDSVETIIATQAMFHLLRGTFGPPPGGRQGFIDALVEVPAKVRGRSGKPIVIVLPIGGDEVGIAEVEEGRRRIRDRYLSMKVPSYPTLERAAQAVANVATYYDRMG
jgi:acyl-CoA synthetase (NDP forming)